MRRVVEDCLSLDSNRLARSGWFRGRYQTGALSWSNDARIGVNYRANILELRYTKDGISMAQDIHVEAVPCRFGGVRYYFYCLGCRKRRCKLQLGGSGFYCRGCYRLPYYSQQCGYLDGLIQQKHKVERKLENCSKYTRAKTVGQIIDALEEAEQRVDIAFLQRFGRLECIRHGLMVGGVKGLDSRI